MARIEKETANVWEHTNGNNATIANVVDLLKPRLDHDGPNAGPNFGVGVCVGTCE